MKNLFGFLLLIFIIQSMTLSGQNFVLPLYAGPIPNSKYTGSTEKVEKSDIILIKDVQIPDISVFLPARKFATGQAVIICPGGGYWVLAYDYEGTDIAKYLNSIGVAAIVLKYRLPTYGNCIEPYKAPLMDAQRALRIVRFNAEKWNISPDKIGVMGFSAGGHLASSLGTHFDYGNTTSADSIEQQSCHPDFMILMYPVISFIDTCCHIGSREALLGKNPSKELVLDFSNELQVRADTPPAFIVHAGDDTTVPVENALLMYKALIAKKIPAELHILSEGGHGFGLGLNNRHVASWTGMLSLWLGNLKI